VVSREELDLDQVTTLERVSLTRSITNPNVLNRNVPGSIMLDAPDIDKIPWFDDPVIIGLASKYLMIDLNRCMSYILVKIGAGVKLPVHVHFGTATILCLKGRFTYEAGSIGPGGFGWEPYGVVHEPDATTEETILFIINTANALIHTYNEDGSLGPAYQMRDGLKFARDALGDIAVAHLGLPDWFWND
jgi:anti-sigma factor ChrR (cupin superfamily)